MSTIHITVLDSPVTISGEKTQAVTRNGTNSALNRQSGHENQKVTFFNSTLVKNTNRSTWRADWFTWITRLIVLAVIVGSIYFIFWLLLPTHSHIALRYSRYYEAFTTVFMIISTIFMSYKIYRWRTDVDRRSGRLIIFMRLSDDVRFEVLSSLINYLGKTQHTV